METPELPSPEGNPSESSAPDGDPPEGAPSEGTAPGAADGAGPGAAEATRPAEAPDVPHPGLAKRLMDAFVSPGRMAEALARNPTWAAALVVGAVLIIAQTLLIPADIWEAVFREAALQRGSDVPEGFAMGGTFMRLSAVIGGGIMWFVFAFLMAGITTLIFAFILGDEGRYRQYLAVLAHAWVIPATVGVLLVPLKIMSENPQLTLNLGSFFFFLPSGYFLKVLTALDLSQIWAWLILAQGAHAIDSRRSFRSAAMILLGLALVMAMIFAPLMPDM